MDRPQTATARARAWSELDKHRDRLRTARIGELLDAVDRAGYLVAEACGIVLDCSKQRLDVAALEALLALARACDLEARRDAMYDGAPVNVTESRPALHVALRRPREARVAPAQRDVHGAVHGVLDRMQRLVDGVRQGQRRGYSGEPITDVVNIGIGGSDLGPAMACRALVEHSPAAAHGARIRTHFVSNLDATQLFRVLDRCDPAHTLFVVASKTFSTRETLLNAESARRWLLQAAGTPSAVAHHFVAVTANARRAADLGIPETNLYEFWDWVGGRYSMWSAIGLPIACQIGMDGFHRLLAGAHAMDEHFRQAPLARNLPVLLALVGIWNRNQLAVPAHAVLPYDFALELLPAYLQQLEMESNGKRVSACAQALGRDSVPIVWGSLGNNAQHAYFQMLHQGTQVVSVDFIAAARPQRGAPGHDTAVLANALAQAETLMRGRSADDVRAELARTGLEGDALEAAVAHRVMTGNRPSSFILYDRLSPERLGALIALYEHKVFVQAACWGINPFDQFGVELGKQLASDLESVIEQGGEGSGHDASTRSLLERIRRMRGGA